MLFEVLSDSCYSNQIYNSTVSTNRLVLLAGYILVYMMFYDRQFVFIVGIFFLQNMAFMFVESPGFVCYAPIL